MGKCISKNKTPEKENIINRNRREESICTPVQSEGARNLVYSGPMPVFLNKSDINDSLLQHSLKPLPKIEPRKKVHNRTPSKISIDFDHLSKLKIEQEMLLRIGRSLHELARCYQTIKKYSSSIDILQLAGEIYMHLSMYGDYNTAMSDLLIAFIATNNINRKLPIVVEPLDERTLLVCAMFKKMSENKKEPILSKYKIKDFDKFLTISKEIDSCKLGSSNLFNALIDLAHLFRIWLRSPEESLNLYEEACNIDPENAEVYFYKGLTYRALGELELSIDNYIQGIHKKANYAECYYNLGNIYLEEYKNFKEAEACYLNALFVCENGHQGLVSIGKICAMLAEVYALQENYNKALEIIFQGIGGDCLYIENFTKAAKLAKIVGFDCFGAILECVERIFKDEELESLPGTIEGEAVGFKNVLFGSVGELLAFLKKMPSIENLSKSEKIEVKKRLGKVTKDQVERLAEFHSYIERL